jgi:hypothetical protein
LGWPGDREVLIFASSEDFRLEKAGLAPAFLFVATFYLARHCHLLPLKPAPQQTVDGAQGVLEILSRSSYVPNSPIGDRSRHIRRCAPERCAVQRARKCLLWMK